MFDLLSFIRQLLPPHRRQPLTIALAKVLFGPAQAIMNSLVATRQTLLDQTRTTGQVIVLESLLSRLLASQTNTVVYITEGNSVNYDFTVIVPADVSTDQYGKIQSFIDRYKLAGKRYQLSQGVHYDVIDNSDALAWTTGYPYIADSTLYWAINKVGTYYSRVSLDDTLLIEDNIPYRHGTISSIDIDPTRTYTVSVGTLTATVSKSVKNLQAQAGYLWDVTNGRTLFLGFNASEPPAIILYKPDGTTVLKAAESFGVSFANVSYGYRTYYTGLTNGLYRVAARIPGTGTNQYDGYITLTDSNSGQGLLTNGIPAPDVNIAPVVNRQVAQQSATVGTAYSQNIPSDTFLDNDGRVASVAVSGLPDGLTAQINNLVVVITGTPTTAGNATVVVTATDDKGATTTMQFVIATQAAVVPGTPTNPTNPTNPTIPTLPTSGFGPSVVDAPANPGLLDLRLTWVQIGGQWFGQVSQAATPGVDGGKHVYYFINGNNNPDVDSFTTRNYQPGTWINVYAGVGPRKEVYHDGYNPKSTQQIWIGDPNT